MVYRKTQTANIALAFLLLVLLSNFLLYRPQVQDFFSLQLTSGVAIGSLIDLAIVAPLLVYATFKISVKQVIGLMVGGLVIARFFIPYELFSPFKGILYLGIAFEALLILAELSLIFLVIYKTPKIKAFMTDMNTSPLFSLIPSIKQVVTQNILIRIVVSEFLMFYYAIFTWKKKAPSHPNIITLHKKTSYIAFNVMIIHAIIIETIGLHWWLHDKSILLSFVLLIFNIYSVFYFLADIQVTRLHPAEIKNGNLYVTQGLSARIVVPLHLIKNVEWGVEVPDKNTLQFMYRDFESLEPQALIHLHEPIEATMFMGKEKVVTQFAIRVDEPQKLKELLETR
ncbi:MAG: beta-carotene 15,15'-monooxygenase [Psychrobacillus sp.]